MFTSQLGDDRRCMKSCVPLEAAHCISVRDIEDAVFLLWLGLYVGHGGIEYSVPLLLVCSLACMQFHVAYGYQ